VTSLSVDELQPLVPPFEAAFQAHMADWRRDGKRRTARRYATDQNCPLPTPEDRLLVIRVYLQTSPLQVVQGRLFGMGQSKAHQWLHGLLAVLRVALRARGEAPIRSLADLAHRLGMTEAAAAALVRPTEALSGTSDPLAAAPASATASPLSATMAPHGAARAPRIRLSQGAVIAARKHTLRGNTSC
jgi:Helix-turn-helix of DDE superfamily endonuclease